MNFTPRVRTETDKPNAWKSHELKPRIRLCEVFGFAGDTGYDNNFEGRLTSAAKRAIEPLIVPGSGGFTNPATMLPFNEGNLCRIIVEVLPPGSDMDPDAIPKEINSVDSPSARRIKELEAEIDAIQADARIKLANSKPIEMTGDALAEAFLQRLSDKEKARFSHIVSEAEGDMPTSAEGVANLFAKLSDEDKAKFVEIAMPAPQDVRRAELDKLTKKELLAIADSLGLKDLTERTSNTDIITAILGAEFPED